eukprot:GDKK01064922.1.p1 GENE.GDKK01064922.1~~GDKK01064922.1.p1  ORF type:complete len:297 (+),score=56.70 GDKK01064922.1:384-1274(+)
MIDTSNSWRTNLHLQRQKLNESGGTYASGVSIPFGNNGHYAQSNAGHNQSNKNGNDFPSYSAPPIQPSDHALVVNSERYLPNFKDQSQYEAQNKNLSQANHSKHHTQSSDYPNGTNYSHTITSHHQTNYSQNHLQKSFANTEMHYHHSENNLQARQPSANVPSSVPVASASSSSSSTHQTLSVPVQSSGGASLILGVSQGRMSHQPTRHREENSAGDASIEAQKQQDETHSQGAVMVNWNRLSTDYTSGVSHNYNKIDMTKRNTYEQMLSPQQSYQEQPNKQGGTRLRLSTSYQQK